MNKTKLSESIERFRKWEQKNKYGTYDQYDFWSTKYGIWSKEVYYRNKIAGGLFVAPIFAGEVLLPATRKLFTSKKRFPIADAHLILGLLNLNQLKEKTEFVEEAREISQELYKSSSTGYSGYCWGYPFNWMTTRGLWKKGTPLITTTGYCYEAFIRFYEATNENNFLETAKSIFRFAKEDLKDTYVDEKTEICSYSPIDNAQIVNANAYRSFVLVDGAYRFGDEEALIKAKKNINFIIKSQNSDGSWLYAVNDPRDAFVDNFHTCFVLKNLWKANQHLGDPRISECIKKGFEFYKHYLLDNENQPLPFARLPRLNIVKRELYDYAEAITLCCHLKSFDKDAVDILSKLVNEVIEKYQKSDGSFVTRVGIFGIRNRIPYMRWPQAQLFFALTNSLLINQ